MLTIFAFFKNKYGKTISQHMLFLEETGSKTTISNQI